MAASKQILLVTQRDRPKPDDPDPDRHLFGWHDQFRAAVAGDCRTGRSRCWWRVSNRARVDSLRAHGRLLQRTGFHAGRKAQGAESAEDRGAGAFPAPRVSNSTSRSTRRSRRKLWRPCPASTMPRRLTDTISPAHMTLKLDEKQKILEILSVRERMEALLKLIESETGHAPASRSRFAGGSSSRWRRASASTT